MKRRIALFCLSMGSFFAATSLPAEAGTRVLWPDKCRPVSTLSNAVALSNARQSFASLGTSPGNAAMYECEVRVPVGTEVTGVMVNGTTGGGGFIDLLLQRRRLGGDAETLVHLIVGDNSARDWYSTREIVPERARVKPGYRYFVTVTIFSGIAYGMKVSYR